jgi:GT2 family glycosyltransferase
MSAVVGKAQRPTIAVGIATAGRREILSRTIEAVAGQSRPPDTLFVCPVASEDFDSLWTERLPYCSLVHARQRGLTSQRNSILSAAADADIIVFFDDDFFPGPGYLAEVEAIFTQNDDVVALTGRPIQDGANGPGLTIEQALGIIASDRTSSHDASVAPKISPTYGAYGCNMSFRMEPIVRLNARFDEKLPLYGWQEDIDFSRQLSSSGRIVEANSLRGVHLGAKGGRTSGFRFGYSQIANPIYLVRKGTMSVSFALWLMWRNVGANLSGSFRPEPWIDRRGRLLGNLRAFLDLALWRISPQRILDLG